MAFFPSKEFCYTATVPGSILENLTKKTKLYGKSFIARVGSIRWIFPSTLNNEFRLFKGRPNINGKNSIINENTFNHLALYFQKWSFFLQKTLQCDMSVVLITHK